MAEVLEIHKLADKSSGTREVRYKVQSPKVLEDGSVFIDPTDVERILFNPETEGFDHEPWPLLGIELAVKPQECAISTNKVDEGVREGWIVLKGENVEHKPGGPPDRPWSTTHTFQQASHLIFRCVDGDVTYKVVHQPDVYDDPDEASGRRVDWFYGLKLEA